MSDPKNSTMVILIPRVIANFRSKFPETFHNAYPYFNYDNRVVEKSVERGDPKIPYLTAKDLTEHDFEDLVRYAQTLKNPILQKYSPKVANEDALHTAIHHFRNGFFDSKINANAFIVLAEAMESVRMAKAKEKKEKPETERAITPDILKRLHLTLKELPRKQQLRRMRHVKDVGVPYIYKSPHGKPVIKKDK